MSDGAPSSVRAVLLGFAESLAAIEAAWDLLDHGFSVHAFCRRNVRPALAKDDRVKIHWIGAPEGDVALSISDLYSLVEALDWPILLPLDDTSILLMDAIRSKSPDTIVAGPTGDLARLSLDKRIQLAVASTVGLSVPLTISCSVGAEIDDDAISTIAPPWIVKPALAVAVRRGRVSKGRTESFNDLGLLKKALKRRDDDFLVQTLLRGVGRGVFGQASSGHVSNWSGHERIRMMNPSGSGSSACVSVDPEAELVAACGRFVGEARWNGLFMLEFLVDHDGVPWFMELNGRAWGSLALAVNRGFAYPTWTAQNAADPSQLASEVAPGPHLVARHVGRELLHLALVARGRWAILRSTGAEGQDPALLTYPGLLSSAKDVLRWRRGERAYNFRASRQSVFWSDTAGTLIGHLNKTPLGRST